MAVERYLPMRVVRRFKLLREQCRVFWHTEGISKVIASNTRCSANKKALIGTSFLDTREPLEMLLFIFDRRQVIAEAVPALRIVKHLDVIEYILSCLFPSTVGLASGSLPFQQLEEAFGRCVIVAVSSSAHTLLQIVLVQEVAPAAELTALIRMYHHRVLAGQRQTVIKSAFIASSRSIRQLINQSTT